MLGIDIFSIWHFQSYVLSRRVTALMLFNVNVIYILVTTSPPNQSRVSVEAVKDGVNVTGNIVVSSA